MSVRAVEGGRGRRVAEALRRCLPAGVEIAVCEPPTPELALPEELELTGSMVEKRRLEFLGGRTCVRLLMRRMGLPDEPLRIGRSRAPEWPRSLVGSLSHTAGCCVAALAPRTVLAGIGVDVEREGRVREELEHLVITPQERAHRDPRDDDWRTLLFSAKESVYKVVQPLMGLRPGFTEVRVRLGRRQELAAEVLLPEAAGLVVRGSWVLTDGLVVTAAYVRRDAA